MTLYVWILAYLWPILIKSTKNGRCRMVNIHPTLWQICQVIDLLDDVAW